MALNSQWKFICFKNEGVLFNTRVIWTKKGNIEVINWGISYIGNGDGFGLADLILNDIQKLEFYEMVKLDTYKNIQSIPTNKYAL